MRKLNIKRVIGGYEYTDSTGVTHEIYQNLEGGSSWYKEWIVTDHDYYTDPLSTLRECKEFLFNLEEELSSFRQEVKEMDENDLKELLRPSAFASKSQLRLVREELRLRGE